MKITTRRLGLLGAVGAAVVLIATLGYLLGQGQTVQSPSYESGSMPTAAEAPMEGYNDQASKQSYGSLGAENSSVQRDVATDGGAVANAGVDRLVIRTANMDVQVKSVDSALDGVRAAARKTGAEVSDLSVVAGEPRTLSTGDAAPSVGSRGPATAYVTLRVPAQKLDALEAEIAGLGVVLTRASNSNDVTEQAIDMEARLKNLHAEEARLRTFLDRTSKVSELLEVERELSRVRGEIESMDAQLTYLKRQVARSTLTVTLTEPGPVVQPAGPTWGLREAVTRGIQAAASLTTTLITVAIPLALLGILFVLVVWPIRLIVRRGAARKHPEDQQTPPEESR